MPVRRNLAHVKLMEDLARRAGRLITADHKKSEEHH
jgi:hypothetical protein